MKPLCTHENTDVFITHNENIYGILNKKVNILYIFCFWTMIYLSFLFFVVFCFSKGSTVHHFTFHLSMIKPNQKKSVCLVQIQGN